MPQLEEYSSIEFRHLNEDPLSDGTSGDYRDWNRD